MEHMIDSNSSNSMEYLFREALNDYESTIGDNTKAYAVCWYTYLLERLNTSIDKQKVLDEDENIYKIKATCSKDAVEKFLLKKAEQEYYKSKPLYKEKCVREIVESTYKYGKMQCLAKISAFRDFFFDLETTIDGKYYSVKDDEQEDNIAIVDAIIKSIDLSDILPQITRQVFLDVYVEAHLYDVAVFELSFLRM